VQHGVCTIGLRLSIVTLACNSVRLEFLEIWHFSIFRKHAGKVRFNNIWQV